MLIMAFLITQGQSHVIISVNIIEAKLFFVLTGFEPWTSRSAIQYPNH